MILMLSTPPKLLFKRNNISAPKTVEILKLNVQILPKDMHVQIVNQNELNVVASVNIKEGDLFFPSLFTTCEKNESNEDRIVISFNDVK